MNLLDNTTKFKDWRTALVDELENAEMQIDDLRGYIGYTDPDILGVEVDFANNRFTRLAGAVGLEAGEDFDQFPMYNRRRCNLTDDGRVTAYWDDEAYTETGFTEQQIIIDDPYGTGMDRVVAEGTPVQVMVEQKPFYYKVVPLELEPAKNGQWAITKARYYISDKPKAGFTLHPAFDPSGRYNIYLAAYEGSRYNAVTGEYESGMINTEAPEYVVDIFSDKLSSVVGAKVLEASRNGMFEEMEMCLRFDMLAINRGQKWQLENICHISITQLLFLIEYASFNAQECIGNGLTGTGVAETGYTSSLGNASGTATGFEGTAVSYRGQENLWGNTSQYIDMSVVDDDGRVNLIRLGIDLRGVSEAFLPVSTVSDPMAGQGWVSRFLYKDGYFLPAKLDGDSHLPVGDYFELSRYHPTLVFGGHYGDLSGLFAYFGRRSEPTDMDRVSARLVYVDSPTHEMLR